MSKNKKENNIDKKINSKKLIISIIISCLIYCCLAQEGYINKYNIVLLPMIFFISYFIYNCKIEKKFNKISVIISLLYSILFLLGSVIQDIMFNNSISIISSLINIHSILKLSATLPIFYIVVMKLITLLEEINIEKKEKNIKKIFIKSSFCMFLLWIPYFLIYIPGFLTPDSIGQVGQIISGTFNNHHPVTHTLFEFIPYRLGMLLFNNSMIATSMITITQMIVMSLIYSYLITFLYKRKINKVLLIIIFCYYAILPMNILYSITLWKDIVFAGLILVLTIELIKLIEYKNFTIKRMIRFGFICLLSMLFRHNALYMMFLLSIILIIFFRKQIKYILPTFIIVFSIYFIINIPIFDALNIRRSASVEYIAMPLQQLGRIAYKNGNFTKKEKKELAKVISVEKMKKLYEPRSADSIKFNRDFNIEYFNKHKIKYFKLYLSIIMKNKTTAIEAYLSSTLGYWYPNVDNWTVETEVFKNPFGIKSTSIIPKKAKDKLSLWLITKSVPLYNFIWSIGLYVWLVILSFGYSIYRKEYYKMIIYIPIIGIWLSLLVAAPVFAEYRYMYSFVTTLPLIVLVPKMKIKKEGLKC